MSQNHSNRPTEPNGLAGESGGGRHLLMEVFGLALLFWVVFLVLILATYTPADPSMNHVIGRVAAIKNAGGVFGAYLSGVLVDLFGLSAVVWPMLFLGWGMSCVSRFRMPWWRWLGFMMLGGVISVFGAMRPNVAFFAVSGGGIFGTPLTVLLDEYVGCGGMALALLFAFFLAVELCSGISWWNMFVKIAGRAGGVLADHGLTWRPTADRCEVKDGGVSESQAGSAIQLVHVDDGEDAVSVFSYQHEAERRMVSDGTPPWMPQQPAERTDKEQEGDAALGASIQRLLNGRKGQSEERPVDGAELVAPIGGLPSGTQPSACQPVDFDSALRNPDTTTEEGDSLAGAVAPARTGRQTVTQRRRHYVLPKADLLQPAGAAEALPSRDSMRIRGEQLMACLADFNVNAELVRVTPGPVVTMFELRPAPGTKVARILGLHEDIALNLKALAVRIQTMPGSDTVGVEIPNEHRATVNFKSIVESDAFKRSSALLTLTLGVSIGGAPVVADLAKMPHLLVGGSTGSGKSVCINAFLLSLLCKCRPDEMKLLMIDPKRVELSMYADLPHLIHPVVNEPVIAKNALDWAVHEMERRYALLAKLGVRKFDAYNAKLCEMGADRPQEFADMEPMPYLVIVIDELADLMMTAGKEVEASIVRLAQLARAAGIHLIVATQRPSVDVVTGLIKANFPSRVSFRVTSVHDSRTILDSAGAELLLGLGDMLFKSGGEKAVRLHGPFVPDNDVEAVVNFWKRQGSPEYTLDFAEWGQSAADDLRMPQNGRSGNSEDDLYNEVVAFALSQNRNLSISKIQRQFRIGFNKAARFMEQMEQDGIIGAAGHANRPRDVINPSE